MLSGRKTLMLSNRLVVGWCIGALVSIGGPAASSAELDPAAFSGASVPPITGASSVTRIAQKTPERADSHANIPNPANVSLQMSPDRTVEVGTKISFRVTAKKRGYLLLVDIDADGRMSQIFPSPEMLARSEEAAENLLRPGEALVVPNAAAQKSGFEYVITPPTGEAAVVAILSDRRVQLLDLPDDAQKPRTEAETINYLTGWTSGLRVPDSGTGKLQPSNWSFDIKQYSIK